MITNTELKKEKTPNTAVQKVEMKRQQDKENSKLENNKSTRALVRKSLFNTVSKLIKKPKRKWK